MKNNLNTPYRYTIKGNATIVDTDDGKYVIKKKDVTTNIKGLFNYLKSRGFSSFADVISDEREEVNVFEYVHSIDYPSEQKADDLIDIISNLHSKSFYFKEVREDKFKEVYESVLSNINYLKDYYNDLYSRFFREIYMAPSHYLFMKNYYKINEALDFCEAELDSWYEDVRELKKLRVCVIHNNLSIDHFIKGDKDAIISWEQHKIDTPTLDLVKLYKNDFLKYDYKYIFDKYNDNFPMTSNEKKLFFILVSLPEKITFDYSEFKNTVNLRLFLDYIFKSEELIKPYYSKEIEE